MRKLFCLIALVHGVTSNLMAQDSLFWVRYDAVVDSLFRVVDTGEEALVVMGPLLAARREAGPVNEALAYRYHWIALKSGIFGAFRAKPYADTAIQLRTEAKVVKADIAQSIYQRGRVLKDMARHQSSLKDFEVAVKMMDEAYREATSMEKRKDLAYRLGYFYREAANSARENGNFGLADLWLDQIPDLLLVGPNPLTKFAATRTRADVHTDAGRFSKAIALYQSLRALPNYADINPIDQAAVAHNLGTTYRRSGTATTALPYLEEAADLLLGVKDLRRLSFVESEMAKVLTQLGAFSRAQAMLEQGLNNAKNAYPNGKAAVLGELYAVGGELLARQDDFIGAESLFRLGFQSLLEQPSFAGPANLPQIEGAIIYSREEFLEVLTAKRDAHVRAFEQGVAADGLALALLTAQKIDTVFRRSREDLSLTASLADLYQLENEAYETATNLALRRYRLSGDPEHLTEAYHFATGRKSNLLRRYLSSPTLASNMGVAEDLVSRKSAVEWQIATTEASLAGATGADAGRLRDSLLSLRTEEVSLRAELMAKNPAYVRALRGLPGIDPAVVATLLAPEQLVVDYLLGADSVYLFTLEKTAGLEVKVMARPDKLEELIAQVVDGGSAATALYELLVAPILAGRPKIKRVQFIPDGALWKIPFAALRSGNRFLIEDIAVSYAYASTLIFADAKQVPGEYLGFGISYKDVLLNISASDDRSRASSEIRSMGRLPWAEKEVSEAAGIMNGAYRLEAEATKNRFLEEAQLGNILHLSMHGLLRENPLESALVFLGQQQPFDLLTMGEVLRGNYPAELTVLSACHTGGGPVRTSEGMQSIGRAFTAAGSRATITSTWEARDDATHDILVDFYQQLRDGQPKDVALQQAILHFLQAGSATDRMPTNWANLTLTGSVQPLGKPLPWWLLGLGLLALATLTMGWWKWRNGKI